MAGLGCATNYCRNWDARRLDGGTGMSDKLLAGQGCATSKCRDRGERRLDGGTGMRDALAHLKATLLRAGEPKPIALTGYSPFC
jgi:hypothetical protein